MKNHIVVLRPMLEDLRGYLQQSGWALEEPKGKYEVHRARLPGRATPLLIHSRERGCGYSIDERDMKVYRGWQRSRRRRGLDPYSYTKEEWEAYWNEKT